MRGELGEPDQAPACICLSVGRKEPRGAYGSEAAPSPALPGES